MKGHNMSATIVEQLIAEVEVFKTESEKFLAGNKAAGARARKATLAIEKLGKSFRKESVK